MFKQTTRGAIDLILGDEPIALEGVERVRDLLDACNERGQPQVVLDLNNVPLLDSAALEMLLDVQESFQRRGGVLKLAGAGPLCREILKVTGVDRQFEIYEESGAAVGSFRI